MCPICSHMTVLSHLHSYQCERITWSRFLLIKADSGLIRSQSQGGGGAVWNLGEKVAALNCGVHLYFTCEHTHLCISLFLFDPDQYCFVIGWPATSVTKELGAVLNEVASGFTCKLQDDHGYKYWIQETNCYNWPSNPGTNIFIWQPGKRRKPCSGQLESNMLGQNIALGPFLASIETWSTFLYFSHFNRGGVGFQGAAVAKWGDGCNTDNTPHLPELLIKVQMD